MARPQGLFHMEAAGSLTPELEGGARSGHHPRPVVTKPAGNTPKRPTAEDKPHDP